MSGVSSVPAGDLADVFLQWSREVDNYRDRNFDTLAPDEQTRLKDLSHQLDDISAHLTLVDISETLASMDCDLAQIESVTARAKQELKKSRTVVEVIQITSAVAALGLAISSGNVGTIGGALADLGKLVPGSVRDAG